MLPRIKKAILYRVYFHILLTHKFLCIMVTIIDYKECVSQEGRNFNAILVQGGCSIAISKETGNPYLTANKMLLNTTFNKQVCQSLIGSTLPGDILKVPCPYYVYHSLKSNKKCLGVEKSISRHFFSFV